MFDPEVLQILGLNLMTGRSPNFAENLGNAGLATMQYRRQQEEDKLRKEEREYLKQQREMQMAQMKRQAKFSSDVDALIPQFMRATSIPYNDTLGDQPPQGDIQGSSQLDTAGLINALPSLGLPGIEKAAALRTMLQKESGFGKIDPKDFTQSSVAKFAVTGNYADLVPRVKMESVDTGGRVEFVDAYNPPQGGLTKNLTPADQQRIPLERTNTGISLARASDEGITGLPGMPPPLPNYRVGAPPPAPVSPASSAAPPAVPSAARGVPGLSPKQQREMAGKQALEKATAASSLPQVEAEATQTMSLIDKLVSHPGFSTVVGAKGVTGFPASAGYPIPGTDAADFVVLRNQLVGKQFLQAYETLKGSGQITEIEGKKATDAIARMDTSQSEKEFKAAAAEFRGVIEAGLNRARAKAGVTDSEETKTVVIGGRSYEARRGKHGKFYVQMGNKFYEVSK